jgi:hypothetical protein
MKKIILAAITVMSLGASLGVGVANAETMHHNNGRGSSGWQQMATNGT